MQHGPTFGPHVACDASTSPWRTSKTCGRRRQLRECPTMRTSALVTVVAALLATGSKARYRQTHQASPATSYSTLVSRSYAGSSDFTRAPKLEAFSRSGMCQCPECGLPQDPELIARQALDGTNQYRASKAPKATSKCTHVQSVLCISMSIWGHAWPGTRAPAVARRHCSDCASACGADGQWGNAV